MQNKTDNIMDYGGGIAIWSMQWDKIHKQSFKLNGFEDAITSFGTDETDYIVFARISPSTRKKFFDILQQLFGDDYKVQEGTLHNVTVNGTLHDELYYIDIKVAEGKTPSGKSKELYDKLEEILKSPDKYVMFTLFGHNDIGGMDNTGDSYYGKSIDVDDTEIRQYANSNDKSKNVHFRDASALLIHYFVEQWEYQVIRGAPQDPPLKMYLEDHIKATIAEFDFSHVYQYQVHQEGAYVYYNILFWNDNKEMELVGTLKYTRDKTSEVFKKEWTNNGEEPPDYVWNYVEVQFIEVEDSPYKNIEMTDEFEKLVWLNVKKAYHFISSQEEFQLQELTINYTAKEEQKEKIDNLTENCKKLFNNRVSMNLIDYKKKLYDFYTENKFFFYEVNRNDNFIYFNVIDENENIIATLNAKTELSDENNISDITMSKLTTYKDEKVMSEKDRALWLFIKKENKNSSNEENDELLLLEEKLEKNTWKFSKPNKEAVKKIVIDEIKKITNIGYIDLAGKIVEFMFADENISFISENDAISYVNQVYELVINDFYNSVIYKDIKNKIYRDNIESIENNIKTKEIIDCIKASAIIPKTFKEEVITKIDETNEITKFFKNEHSKVEFEEYIKNLLRNTKFKFSNKLTHDVLEKIKETEYKN